MLGYMTAKEALASGFTHHGDYYKIPVWIAPAAGFMVATKWGPMEYAMTVAMFIEQFLLGVFFPNDEPGFRFAIGREIEGE